MRRLPVLQSKDKRAASAAKAGLKRRKKEPKLLKSQAILQVSRCMPGACALTLAGGADGSQGKARRFGLLAPLQGAHQAKPVRTSVSRKRTAPAPSRAAKKPRVPAQEPPAAEPLLDAWLGADSEAASTAMQAWHHVRGQTGAKRGRQHANVIKAVEVDMPGCSYNPDPELHQEAVAVAVAAEVKKAIDKELLDKAPARTVDYIPVTDELAQLLVGGLAPVFLA
jgi:Nop53 (60S ribosomal biogenesis)